MALGTATDYDVLAARVAVENARPEVIRTDNTLRRARLQLRYLLAEESREVDVVGTLAAPIEAAPSYDELLAQAIRHRPELAEVTHTRNGTFELVKIYGANDRPRLDLRGAYGWRGLDVADLTTAGKVWSAGVYLSFPMFDGLKTRAKVAQARSNVASLDITEAKVREGITLELQAALDAVTQAGEIVKALEGTVVQAERLLKMAEQGYELGVMRKLDVDDAQTAVIQARGAYARAQRDYLVAEVNLRWSVGTLGEGSPS
jgi:outer membrane protein TolC